MLCVTLALGYNNVVFQYPSPSFTPAPLKTSSLSHDGVFSHSKLYIYHHFNRKTTTEAGAIIIFMYTHIIFSLFVFFFSAYGMSIRSVSEVSRNEE